MKRFALALLCVACSTKSPAKASSDTPTSAAPSEADGDHEVSHDEATAGLPKDGKLVAEITTELGTIHCELLPDIAPKTVASFVGLARGIRPYKDPSSGKWVKGNFYDGLTFHRVIPDFMIQGGDPQSRDPGNRRVGSGGPGYTLPDELDKNLKFDHPGVMAMANTGPRTHSGGSQFFITEVPYPSLDGGYVTFGQCEDLEVVKSIARGTRGNPAKMQVKILRK